MKRTKLGRSFVEAIVAVGISLGSGIALADFTTLSNGFGSKWGDPNYGTPSDLITWSFLTDGTSLASTHPLVADGAVGTSNVTSLENAFDASFGVGSFQQAIENAFNTWTVASQGRVTFQRVADNGAVAGDSSIPASYATDIRIGAFHSTSNSNFSFVGAVGYGPPGNDLFFPDALAGDIIINLDSQFIKAAGNEGDIFYTGGIYKNDLEGLILHELGHAAIGLGHSVNGAVPGLGDVMYVDDFPNSVNFINRQLSSQDIAGLQRVYGITAVPEPSSLALMSLVVAIGLSMCWVRRSDLQSSVARFSEP